MHILYLHQYFAVPKGTTGTRSYEFARRWVAKGHEITVITGHTDTGGLEYRKGMQNIDGINVYIVGSRYSNKQSFARRILAFFQFMLLSFFKSLSVKNVDVVYATSTPLTIGIPAMLLKWIKRKPFFFEVRDQWPEIPIEMGFIRNPLLKWFLIKLERRIYLSSCGVVALSPGMAEGVKESLGTVDRKVIIASNCSDLDRFRPNVDSGSLRANKGWQDKFLLMHCGAMGRANGLDFLIEAAKKLQEHKDIHFVLAGGGSEAERLSESIKSNQLNNIEMVGTVPKHELPVYFAACDVSLVIFANYKILQHNSANKFFDSLSAGKPVLLNYSGWQRDEIENADAGFGTELCDLDEFVDKVLKLYNNRQMLPEMGANARKLAELKFSRDKIAAEVLEFITTPVQR